MIERKEILECDVLIAGGGTAGMMAAIEAADCGSSVIIAEKANTRRSGAGATGNDHFQCYIPEVHGTLDEFMKLYRHGRPGPGMCNDEDLLLAFVKNSFEVVQMWESWGISMRPHGYWEFTGHTLPWILGTHLKYEGLNQKPIFTKEALKRGVHILNRHPLTEVIVDADGSVCGAVPVDLTGEIPKMQVVRCKSVILCTASAKRLMGDNRMGWASYGPNSGASTAAAYRAGARIVGAGVTGTTSGSSISVSRYFDFGGTRTWVGVYTDIDGKPVFMNFSYNTEEDTEYMKWALVHEGSSGILQHLKDEGFDFKRKMLEFATDQYSGGGQAGGPDIINDKQETTVKGLYAAGECMGNKLPGLSPAAVGGLLAGRAAAQYSRQAVLKRAEEKDVVEICAERFSGYLENECSTASPTWEEINVAVINVMCDYCASGILSDELFSVGFSHLQRIKEKMKHMQAGSAHDFMQCLAVEDVVQNAELAMTAGRYRKESCGSYKYRGYPAPNHEYDKKFFSVQRVGKTAVPGLRAWRTEVE